MTCYRMAFQLHALSDDATTVITVQRWNGAVNRAVLLTARNGLAMPPKWTTPAKVDADQSRAVEALTPTSLSEGAARALLRAWGIPDSFCDCGARLPIGLWRCEECGKSGGRSVSGSNSGARRRGDITIHARGPATNPGGV